MRDEMRDVDSIFASLKLRDAIFSPITVCEILCPDRDRERVREWLLPSHSRFLTPESGFTIITIVW